MEALYTELHCSIPDIFNEYGVEIMTPAYEGEPDRPAVVPRERWYAAPARASQPHGANANRRFRTLIAPALRGGIGGEKWI